MKKIISILLCIAICICLFACAEKTQTEDLETNDSEEIVIKGDSYIYYPFYFKNDGITIVEWGEKCEWIDDFEPPKSKFFYTANYIHVFPYTFSGYEWDYDEPITPIIENVDDLKKSRNRIPNYEYCFDLIKNGKELLEIYDDILMVSEYQAENICPGDTYIISCGYTMGARDITKGYMFPVVDGRLAFSDMFDKLYVTNPDKSNMLFNDILTGNDIILEENSDFPIFEDGTPISDLNRYFRIATEKLNKANLKKLYSDKYY